VAHPVSLRQGYRYDVIIVEATCRDGKEYHGEDITCTADREMRESKSCSAWCCGKNEGVQDEAAADPEAEDSCGDAEVPIQRVLPPRMRRSSKRLNTASILLFAVESLDELESFQAAWTQSYGIRQLMMRWQASGS
jgi:hypothetical protein